jgi:hypothetical protein
LPQRAIVAFLGRATFLKAEKTMLASPCKELFFSEAWDFIGK